ncbi:MAG: hypothetical protein OEX02_21430, partial [Cyclobacteriaceae bacterium]|nr:hypothetical protein [Cyclobacteriaceae bacterium]
MREATNYGFFLEGKRKLSIGFGNDQFIENSFLQKIFLGSNFPNPFSDGTVIPFRLPQGKDYEVELGVYDLMGRRAALLLDDVLTGGMYEIKWVGNDRSGKAVANGVYLYVLKVRQGQQEEKYLRKMVVR